MTWVRLWHEGRCGSGLNSQDSEYCWYDVLPSDEILEDDARNHVPSWLEQSERGFRFGFEVLSELPDGVRKTHIERHKRQIAYSHKMLKILGEPSP